MNPFCLRNPVVERKRLFVSLFGLKITRLCLKNKETEGKGLYPPLPTCLKFELFFFNRKRWLSRLKRQNANPLYELFLP